MARKGKGRQDDEVLAAPGTADDRETVDDDTPVQSPDLDKDPGPADEVDLDEDADTDLDAFDDEFDESFEDDDERLEPDTLESDELEDDELDAEPTSLSIGAFDDEEEAITQVVEVEDDDEEESEGLREGEFVCRSCFMAKRESALADPERMLCRDCA